MIRAIVDRRFYLSLILSIETGITLNRRFPFPSGNSVLQLILAEKPMILLTIKYRAKPCCF